MLENKIVKRTTVSILKLLVKIKRVYMVTNVISRFKKTTVLLTS